MKTFGISLLLSLRVILPKYEDSIATRTNSENIGEVLMRTFFEFVTQTANTKKLLLRSDWVGVRLAQVFWIQLCLIKQIRTKVNF